MKYFFLIIVIIHGLIHLMGYAKALSPASIPQLKMTITKPMGMLWFTAALLFIAAAVMFLSETRSWWIVGLIAAVLSQFLIIQSWQDAKYGTIANVIIIIVVVLTYTSILFENGYRSDTKNNIERTNTLKEELLTEEDIRTLPEPVQKYIRYSGAIGKPKIINMKVVFQGEMREKGKDYFPFMSEQYNFFDEPTRLFFMKGEMFGITVPGYHKYMNAEASMDIRLFGLFPVVKHSGEVMNKTETVTLFNDMCLMAPATLIDKRIQWENINDSSCKAIFTNKGITISAILYFNERGQLTDFLSNDRTSINDMKQYPFTTPVWEYKNVQGRNVISRGDALWHYPDGKFTYGKFILKDIKYNIKEAE